MNSRWARTVPLYGESVTRTLYKFARLMGSEYFYPKVIINNKAHFRESDESFDWSDDIVAVDFYERDCHLAAVLFDSRTSSYETVKYRTRPDSKVQSKCTCGVQFCDHWFHPLVRSGIIATKTSLQLLHPFARFDFNPPADIMFSNLMLRSAQSGYEGPHLMKCLIQNRPQSEIVLSKHESTSLVYNSLCTSSTFKRKLASTLACSVRNHFRRLRVRHVNRWMESV